MGGRETKYLKLKLKQIKEKLQKSEKIEKMYLFGSRARGDELLTSDVDVLVISPKYEGIKHTLRMDSYLDLWDENVDLEVFCYTPKEIEKLSKRIGFVSQALKEGIEIK